LVQTADTSGILQLQTASTAALTIDASQNVGIGVTPTYKLDVASTSSIVARFARTSFATGYVVNAATESYFSADSSGNNGFGADATNGRLVFWANSAERMRITSGGDVGIGTSSPAQRLDVQATTAKVFVTSTTGTNTAYFAANNTGGAFQIGLDNSAGTEFGAAYAGVLYRSGANPIVFYTNAAERMRITSAGDVCIGVTAAFQSGKTNIGFDSASNVGITMKQTNANNSGTFLNFAQSGTTIGSISGNATNIQYNTSSDYRLKENIVSMTGALDKVALLKPVTYKWKVDGSDGEGFIAHELQAVVPDCVTGEKDAVDADGNPKYQGIDVSFLVATLTAAIQELKAEFDAYKATHP
jgi:hypothetical protein